MTLLEFSQILFNFTATAAMLVAGSLLGIIAVEIIKSINRAKKVMGDIKQESAELFRKLDKFLLAVASLSFVSKLFKKSKKHENEN